MEDTDNSNEGLPLVFKVNTAVAISKIDGNIKETITGFFPNLNEKESIICNMIVCAHHDLGYGYDDCVVSTTAHDHPIFKNEKEVEDIVEGLIRKGVVTRKAIVKRTGHFVSLNLKGDIQDDIVREMDREFFSAVEQACAIENIEVVE